MVNAAFTGRKFLIYMKLWFVSVLVISKMRFMVNHRIIKVGRDL